MEVAQIKDGKMLGMAKCIAKILCVSFLMLGFSLPSLAKENSEDIIVTARIEKSGYVGEALVYEVRLESRYRNIANVELIKNPAFPNKMKQIRGVTSNSSPEIIKRKGETYYSWVIGRNFIIPSEKGKYKITGGRYVAFIPKERIVDDFFWGKRRVYDYEEVQLSCNDVDFKVNELPKGNDSFSEAVGDFKVSAWFPRGEIYKDNEAYVVFKISGYGSLENLKIPNMYRLFNKGCTLKEVEEREEKMQRNGKLYSEIELICTFIPKENNFEISQMCISFFNPEDKKYYDSCSETLKSEDSRQSKKNEKLSKEAITV